MGDLCDRLRRNDPTLVQCHLSIRGGTNILEALQANRVVNEVVITLNQYEVCPESAYDAARFLEDLAQFLETTDRIGSVWFDKFSFGMMKDLVFPDLLNVVVENQFITELKFHSRVELTTEQVVAILQMSRLRKVALVLRARVIDSGVVAEAFESNRTLEHLNLYETDNLSVVEAGPSPASDLQSDRYTRSFTFTCTI
jgi:hypothetical protein